MRKRIHKIFRFVWVGAGLIFSIWMFSSFQAIGVDTSILESDASVSVEEDSSVIRFSPLQNGQTTGLIFYPGGLVEPEAYAPMARALADEGYFVIIVKLPFRTASFPGQEENVFSQTQMIIKESSGIARWVVGGHSRGAAISTRFAKLYPELLDGLILIGTSHPKEAAFDLSTVSFPVMKIYATNDGLASIEEVKANAVFLPSHTLWVEVDGGNHAQFGYYGTQLGDGEAAISRDAQQAIVLEAILSLLERVSK